MNPVFSEQSHTRLLLLAAFLPPFSLLTPSGSRIQTLERVPAPHKTPCPPPCPAAPLGRVAAVVFQARNYKSFPLHGGSGQAQGAQSTLCPLLCLRSLGVQDLGTFGVPGCGQVTLSLITRGCHLRFG